MRTALWLIVILMTASTATAADWPQWRGPNFNDTTPDTNLPASPDPNTLAWKTPLPGPAQSTPVVCGGRVYLSAFDRADKTLPVVCIDAASGKPLWQKTAGTFDKMPRRNLIASPSPTANCSSAQRRISTALPKNNRPFIDSPASAVRTGSAPAC